MALTNVEKIALVGGIVIVLSVSIYLLSKPKAGVYTSTTGTLPSSITPGSTQYTQITYLQSVRGNIGGALDWTPGLVSMSLADLNTLYTYMANPTTATDAQFNAASAVVAKYKLPTAGTEFD